MRFKFKTEFWLDSDHMNRLEVADVLRQLSKEIAHFSNKYSDFFENKRMGGVHDSKRDPIGNFTIVIYPPYKRKTKNLNKEN